MEHNLTVAPVRTVSIKLQAHSRSLKYRVELSLGSSAFLLYAKLTDRCGDYRREKKRREDEVVGLYSAFLPCCLLSDQNSIPTSS